MCIYVCVWGCLDKYISVATWPFQTKIPGSAPDHKISKHVCYKLGFFKYKWNWSGIEFLKFKSLMRIWGEKKSLS